jgi:hypothetical protein
VIIARLRLDGGGEEAVGVLDVLIEALTDRRRSASGASIAGDTGNRWDWGSPKADGMLRLACGLVDLLKSADLLTRCVGVPTLDVHIQAP